MHVGDDPAAVVENRTRVAAALGLPAPSEWWFLDQVHGADVVTVTGSPPATPPQADAAITNRVGIPLAVLTADCAPVAIVSDDALGVVHVGWRGLLAGVVEAAVTALRAIGTGPVRAVIGPCVRPAHYEFGRGDLDRLVARFGPSVEGRSAGGTTALDLARAVRVACAEVGVDTFDLGWCTAADPDRWFSHRRDGTTGRQALVAVMEAG